MSLNNDGHGVDAAVAAVLFKPVHMARRAENGLGPVSTAQFGSTARHRPSSSGSTGAAEVRRSHPMVSTATRRFFLDSSLN